MLSGLSTIYNGNNERLKLKAVFSSWNSYSVDVTIQWVEEDIKEVINLFKTNPFSCPNIYEQTYEMLVLYTSPST